METRSFLEYHGGKIRHEYHIYTIVHYFKWDHSNVVHNDIPKEMYEQHIQSLESVHCAYRIEHDTKVVFGVTIHRHTVEVDYD